MIIQVTCRNKNDGVPITLIYQMQQIISKVFFYKKHFVGQKLFHFYDNWQHVYVCMYVCMYVYMYVCLFVCTSFNLPCSAGSVQYVMATMVQELLTEPHSVVICPLRASTNVVLPDFSCNAVFILVSNSAGDS